MASETKYYGTGRRKSSVARVFVTPGKGIIMVNDRPFREYLCRDTLATIVMQPLVALSQEKVFDVACSDGLSVDPVTHRCPDNGASVNLRLDLVVNDFVASALGSVLESSLALDLFNCDNTEVIATIVRI